MASLPDIVVDCEHAPSLARFWAAALDGYAVRPYDDAEIQRLAERGLTPQTDPVVFVRCTRHVPGTVDTLDDRSARLVPSFPPSSIGLRPTYPACANAEGG